jgi:hypothetical protein
MEMKNLRTCTTMIFTDGTNSRYAVMRGKMRGKAFNAHSADIVAEYDFSHPVTEADYRTMTAKHATLQAPAVYWQA